MLEVRQVREEDIESIVDIYNYYVENTAITFDYKNQDKKNFKEKINNIKNKYPYLVFLENGKVLGYSYASSFIGREAYSHSCELSIYVKHNEKGTGIGKKLYSEMEKILKRMGITNLYACIGVPNKEDKYLTTNSYDFHKHLGFKEVGFFQNCGYKFNEFYNMVWMEKIINTHKKNLKIVWYENLK